MSFFSHLFDRNITIDVILRERFLQNDSLWLATTLTLYCCCLVAAPAFRSIVVSRWGGAALHSLLPSATAHGTSTCSHHTAGGSFHPSARSNHQPCYGTPFHTFIQWHIGTVWIWSIELSLWWSGSNAVKMLSPSSHSNRKWGKAPCAASTPCLASLVTW